MTRYADTLTLEEWDTAIADDGSAKSRLASSTEVFANRYSVGATAWAAARSAGLHADAEFEVRSCDYSGQQRARCDGIEYEVEAARDRGEFTRLTLKRRLSNG